MLETVSVVRLVRLEKADGTTWIWLCERCNSLSAGMAAMVSGKVHIKLSESDMNCHGAFRGISGTSIMKAEERSSEDSR